MNKYTLILNILIKTTTVELLWKISANCTNEKMIEMNKSYLNWAEAS